MLALPLLATITLHVSTFEVALLSVCSSAAFLLVAPRRGPWSTGSARSPSWLVPIWPALS